MKVILIATLFTILSQASFAEDGKQQRIEQAKVRKLANMDKRIAIIQEAKTCISSANSREDMKACKNSSKTKMQQLKSERKSHRKNN